MTALDYPREIVESYLTSLKEYMRNIDFNRLSKEDYENEIASIFNKVLCEEGFASVSLSNEERHKLVKAASSTSFFWLNLDSNVDEYEMIVMSNTRIDIINAVREINAERTGISRLEEERLNSEDVINTFLERLEVYLYHEGITRTNTVETLFDCFMTPIEMTEQNNRLVRQNEVKEAITTSFNKTLKELGFPVEELSEEEHSLLIEAALSGILDNADKKDIDKEIVLSPTRKNLIDVFTTIDKKRNINRTKDNTEETNSNRRQSRFSFLNSSRRRLRQNSANFTTSSGISNSGGGSGGEIPIATCVESVPPLEISTSDRGSVGATPITTHTSAIPFTGSVYELPTVDATSIQYCPSTTIDNSETRMASPERGASQRLRR